MQRTMTLHSSETELFITDNEAGRRVIAMNTLDCAYERPVLKRSESSDSD